MPSSAHRSSAALPPDSVHTCCGSPPSTRPCISSVSSAYSASYIARDASRSADTRRGPPLHVTSRHLIAYRRAIACLRASLRTRPSKLAVAARPAACSSSPARTTLPTDARTPGLVSTSFSPLFSTTPPTSLRSSTSSAAPCTSAGPPPVTSRSNSRRHWLCGLRAVNTRPACLAASIHPARRRTSVAPLHLKATSCHV